MSKYSECMCKVCEQKRLAAAEVDKLQSMLVKPMSADHEKQYGDKIKKFTKEFDVLAAEEERKVAEYEDQMMAIKTKKANHDKHLNHPFYKEVEEYRHSVRIGQIMKGADKYPEPFTTASWSNWEIIEHAMQENVDQAHYIYAAGERMRELVKQAGEQHKEIDALKAKILKQDKQFVELAQENEKIKYAIIENCNLRKEIDGLQKINVVKTNMSDKAMKDIADAAGVKIQEFKDQAETQKLETEYWRLRAAQNNNFNPVGVPVTSQHHIDFAAANRQAVEDLKKETKKFLNGPFNGGCV